MLFAAGSVGNARTSLQQSTTERYLAKLNTIWDSRMFIGVNFPDRNGSQTSVTNRGSLINRLLIIGDISQV
jgi:hypothetical protein